MPTGFGIESYEGSEGYIFISYAPQDENSIMPLVHEMYRRGHRVRFDDGMMSSEEKCAAIDNAAVDVLFVTKNAVDCERIVTEMNIAAENKLPVIPVYFGVNAEEQPLAPEWKLKKPQVVNGGKGTNFIVDEIERKMLSCARRYTKAVEVKSEKHSEKNIHYTAPIAVGTVLVVLAAAFAVTMFILSLDFSTLFPNKVVGEDGSMFKIRELSAGDLIELGTIEQDGKIENGEEPIHWKVLEVKDDKALVVAENALFYTSYNTTNVDTTWQECTLRQYLNETFYTETFTEEEKGYILRNQNNNDRNDRTDINGGEKTMDVVFCLSLNEIEQYFPEAEDRCCMPTMAAMLDTYGKKTASIGDMWWTRSPGRSLGYAAYVKSLGSIDYLGIQVNVNTLAVRPAMWISG